MIAGASKENISEAKSIGRMKGAESTVLFILGKRHGGDEKRT